MKRQKGFSLIEGLLIVLAISVIGFGGWYVWSQNNNADTTEMSQIEKFNFVNKVATKDEFPDSAEFISEEHGFKFRYPKKLGNDVTIEEDTSVKGKSGKAYTIAIGNNSKLLGGFISRDWEGLNEEPRVGFQVYGNCAVGPNTQNVVQLTEGNDGCVLIRGYEITGDENGYNGKVAQIFLEKEFSETSEYTGLTFDFAPVSVDDFSDDSLNNAYDQETIDLFMLLIKSIEEI